MYREWRHGVWHSLHTGSYPPARFALVAECAAQVTGPGSCPAGVYSPNLLCGLSSVELVRAPPNLIQNG